MVLLVFCSLRRYSLRSGSLNKLDSTDPLTTSCVRPGSLLKKISRQYTTENPFTQPPSSTACTSSGPPEPRSPCCPPVSEINSLAKMSREPPSNGDYEGPSTTAHQ